MIDTKKDQLYCLGIESTADDFSVGIANFNGDLLANISSAYIPETGGIHPREAARHHAQAAPAVVQDALSQAVHSPVTLVYHWSASTIL